MKERMVYSYECIDSTNVQAKRLAEDGAAHGTLVVAEQQTAGRGRRGRAWDSPRGKNLYFTLILKPDFPPERASMLTLVMAVAVKRGICNILQQMTAISAPESLETCINSDNVMWDAVADDSAMGQDVVCSIKWPNDIIIGDKKVCGILTEMSVGKNSINHVLVGVGINVKKQAFAAELVDKATDIETECGQEISRTLLLEHILQAFDEVYEVYVQTCDLSGLQEEYNACLINRNREVKVLDPQGEFTGIARGINVAGELLVEKSDGTVTNIYAGEVSVRGLYGYV